jgi:hypothetical protein
MAEEYPYTGADIERVTGGYVNSGLLRMWISEGRLTPGPRAKSIRGGPRTFDSRAVLKAALMAELRKHGVSLTACQLCADYFEAAVASMDTATKGDSPGVPFYYVIRPESGEAFPLPANARNRPLHEIIGEHGPTVLILDIFEFMDSVGVALNDLGPADETEGTIQVRTPGTIQVRRKPLSEADD